MNLEKYLTNRINNDPRVIKAKQAKMFADGTRNLLLMSKAQGVINDLKETIREELVEELSDTKVSLSDIKSRLSEEDYKLSIFYSGVANYLIDWLDIVVTDMNQLINKAYPGGKVYIWDNIINLGKQAKVQLDQLYKNAESMSLEIADNSDDIFEKVLLLIKDVSTEPMPKKGDIVMVNNSSLEYKVVRIDNRRIDKIQVQTQGQLPMWVNQNNINLIK